MHTHNQVEGGWTELKGKVKECWGQINDDELRQFEGSVQELIGVIQRHTGEAREDIERRLRDLDEGVRPILARAAEAANQYAHSMGDTARESADRVRDNVAAGQIQARRMVRRHPVESVAVAFGVGVVAGVVIGLTVRPR